MNLITSTHRIHNAYW